MISNEHSPTQTRAVNVTNIYGARAARGRARAGTSPLVLRASGERRAQIA